jgi:hypothetical protein
MGCKASNADIKPSDVGEFGKDIYKPEKHIYYKPISVN